MVTLILSQDELEMILAALDSHEYWELTKECDRGNGYSQVPDGEDADIDACRVLTTKLEKLKSAGAP